jgi:hypothetical protein
MRLGAPRPTEHGHTYCDFLHGDKGGFRAMAFGYPETTLLIVSRHLGYQAEPGER